MAPSISQGNGESIELILIRHGETDWNVEKRVQGHLDIDLNAQGRRQAAALGDALRHQEFDAIVSSDLQRASNTAKAIAASHDIPITIDSGLRERCFGIFEGLLYDELESRHPADWRAWKTRDADHRFQPGTGDAETLNEFSARCLSSIARITQRGGSRIVVVAHGGVLECLYRAATGTPISTMRDFSLLNASINRLSWSDSRLTILSWSDVSHLSTLPSTPVDTSVSII